VDSLLASIRCLFEILDKTRTCFAERDQSVLPIKYLQWVKLLIDSFDEKLFLLRGNNAVIEGGFGCSEPLEALDGKLDVSFDSLSFKEKAHYTESNSSSIPELKSNLSMISRSSTMSMIRSPKKGISRSAVFEAPFSRKAFVATRIEQMQADAELFDNGNEYFDDDQTVVTYATVTSRMTFATISSRLDRDVSRPPAIPESKLSFAGQDKSSTAGSMFGFATPPRRSASNDSSSTPFSFASKRAEYMANRVNTMAQLVMAPCIAPSLNEVMPNGVVSRTRNAGDHAIKDSKLSVGEFVLIVSPQSFQLLSNTLLFFHFFTRRGRAIKVLLSLDRMQRRRVHRRVSYL
jgi:hypothetical protein